MTSTQWQSGAWIFFSHTQHDRGKVRQICNELKPRERAPKATVKSAL